MLSRLIVSRNTKNSQSLVPNEITFFSVDKINTYLSEKGFVRGSLIAYDDSKERESYFSFSSHPLFFSLVVEICSDPNKLQNSYGDLFPRVYKVVDIYTVGSQHSSIRTNFPRWITGQYYRLLLPQEIQLLDDYVQNYIKELLETY